MEALLVVTAGSLLLGLGLLPLTRRLALRVGLMDEPDGQRKMHRGPVPLAGGLALGAAFWLALAGLVLLPHAYQEPLLDNGQLLLGLFLGSVVIIAVGVADDCCRLAGRYKLAGQAAAVGVVMLFGLQVQTLHVCGWRLELGLLAAPFTCGLLLAAINSLNLLDGMDGLLGSLGCWLSLALACMAALSGQWWAVPVALALAGALLAFLCFNLPPASIFLGDAGSMLVGLLLGALAIQTSLKAVATLSLLLPVGLLTLPLFDTTAAIVRRKLTGRSIYTTDRGHLHHCLLKRGLSILHTLAVVSVCCLVSCAGVLAGLALNQEWIALLTTLTVVGTLILTGLFGHTEALLVKERLLAACRRAAPARQVQVRLQGTGDWRLLWKVLTEQADRLNLHRLLLDVNAPALHEGYYARWERVEAGGDDTALWGASLPLAAEGRPIGRLDVSGRLDDSPLWSKIAILIEAVDRHTAAHPQPPQAPEAVPVSQSAAERGVAVEACSL